APRGGGGRWVVPGGAGCGGRWVVPGGAGCGGRWPVPRGTGGAGRPPVRRSLPGGPPGTGAGRGRDAGHLATFARASSSCWAAGFATSLPPIAVFAATFIPAIIAPPP